MSEKSIKTNLSFQLWQTYSNAKTEVSSLSANKKELKPLFSIFHVHQIKKRSKIVESNFFLRLFVAIESELIRLFRFFKRKRKEKKNSLELIHTLISKGKKKKQNKTKQKKTKQEKQPRPCFERLPGAFLAHQLRPRRLRFQIQVGFFAVRLRLQHVFGHRHFGNQDFREFVVRLRRRPEHIEHKWSSAHLKKRKKKKN